MLVCPVCKKDFSKLNAHLTRASKKDEKHKKYLEANKTVVVDDLLQKTYKPGDFVSFKGKGEFEVVEDLGLKVIVRRPGNNLIKLTVKKERI
jgi:hypothetical protein